MPSGHYMYQQFNIHKFYVLPTHCIYVFFVDLRTYSIISLSDWFLYWRFNLLMPSGHYMYQQFNIHKFYVLPTHCLLYGSENKQRIFPYATLTDWFLYPRQKVFTTRYGLLPYLKQITFTLPKVTSLNFSSK